MDLLNQAFHRLLTTLNLTDSTSSPQPEDPLTPIIRIALVLRQRLPPDIIPLILDYAELWATIAHTQSTQPDRVGEAQSPKLQAGVLIPAHIPRRAVRRVTFTTVSRDQGWSDFRECHGTYRDSWTWFEASVRGLDERNTADQATLHAQLPVKCTHRNALDLEHMQLCVPDPANYKYGAKRIVTNVHAGRKFKEHVVVWDWGSEDDDVRSMLREVKGGCRIEVAACARYQGWCNYVERVTIEVECAVVRRM